MSKHYWLALWDFDSCRWRPLGWRPTFEATADLVPHVVIAPSTVVHIGTVVCRSASIEEAESAFARLPPPPTVGGVDPLGSRRH